MNLLLILFFIFLLTRIPILLSHGNFVTGDGAVVGIMAKHISEGKNFPFYFYKQYYGGGRVIEAYSAALLFKLFGISGLVLTLVPLAFSFMIILLVYFIIKKYFSYELAFLSAILIIFSGILLEPSFESSGYIETIFFILIGVYIFFNIYFDNKNSLKNLILFGFINGVAYWSFDFGIIFFIFYILLLIAKNRLKFIRRDLLIILPSFLIGGILMVISVIKLGLSFLTETINTQNPNFVTAVKGMFVHDLPRFFGIGNFHNFISDVHLVNWIYYLIFLFSLVCLIYIHRMNLFFFFRKQKIHKELLFLSLLILYFVVYSLSSFSGVAPRYLMPLYPFIDIIIAIFILKIYKNFNYLAYLFIIIFIIVGFVNIYWLFTAKEVVDGKVKTEFDTIKKINEFLNSKNIKYVYTTYFMKWRLIFENKEKIIASCNHLCPCAYRYEYYEHEVDKSDNFAYIFHNSSSYVEIFEDAFEHYNITYKKKNIGNKMIFYSLSKPLRPNFIKKCSWYHDFLPLSEVPEEHS